MVKAEIDGTASVARYIVPRYNISMSEKIPAAEYRALAELRYRIRLFLREGDATALSEGLEPQQYQMLLAIHAGCYPRVRPLPDRPPAREGGLSPASSPGAPSAVASAGP